MTKKCPSNPVVIGDLVIAGTLKFPEFGVVVEMHGNYAGIRWIKNNTIQPVTISHAETLKEVVDVIRKM